eukprot:jgi/Mesvir1/3233/Mv16376-RA.1
MPNLKRTPVAALSSILPESADAAFAPYTWGTCAVVGNSGGLLGAKLGPMIDAHDMVVRINQAPTRGYEQHVGTKTTMRLLNHIYGRMKPERPLYPVEPGVTFVSSRTGADTVREALALYARMQREAGVRILVLNRAVVSHAQNMVVHFRECVKAAGGGDFKGGDAPTSGMVAVFGLINLCQRVSVFGFGENEENGLPYQYYTKLSSRSSGHPVHSFDAESKVVAFLGRLGILNHCTIARCQMSDIYALSASKARP